MRAVRKNGEVFAGSWMVGAKWAVSYKAHYTAYFILVNRTLCVLSGPCASGSNDWTARPSQYPCISYYPTNERRNPGRK